MTCIIPPRKMLNLQHQHNNHTTTPHMMVDPTHWDPPSCEGLLYSCCDNVVYKSNPYAQFRVPNGIYHNKHTKTKHIYLLKSIHVIWAIPKVHRSVNWPLGDLARSTVSNDNKKKNISISFRPIDNLKPLSIFFIFYFFIFYFIWFVRKVNPY
jgi:hypothetical protein